MRGGELPESWDVETDVVVVGGGNAGLPAAIEAADSGSEVTLLEENAFLGGLMRGSGGFMSFCASHVQRRNGVVDCVEWGIEDEMLMSEYRAVPELVRAYVEAGADTCLWLERLGLTFSDDLLDGGPPDPKYGGHRRIARTHYAAASPTSYYPGGVGEGRTGYSAQSGYALTVVLEKAVADLGIPVLLEHRMTAIHREPGGSVVGVRAARPDGSVVDVRARQAVILASGGATTNEQLVRAWDPRLVDDCIHSDGLPYMRAMGDALTLGQDIGASLSDMSFVCHTPVRYGSRIYSLSLDAIAGMPGTTRSTGVLVSPRHDGYQRIILVQNDGKRYLNEAEATYRNPRMLRDSASVPAAEYPEDSFIYTFLSLPRPRNVWAIADAASAAAMKWPLAEMERPEPARGRALHPGSTAVAGDLKELAGKIDVDCQNLIDTVDQYNEFCRDGADLEFGKPQPLYPIIEPPYYAARLHIIRHTPVGGLRINTKGQVLDRAQLHDGETSVGLDEEAVIPRLYAAGECSAFVGYRRAHRKTGPIITMARLAGKSAAAEPFG
ncbi:FAD-dependent oxidoreductase [Amycolatopsis jejuensis]|uniref:FAD-dependent oxidoreductase n=1 Tax=Amycolatopsis jejuensis TaxID=330084 RepID=UPI000A8538A5|nr:FAD-dependent oxidoreductase [Amycolatopsis jejuensis]